MKLCAACALCVLAVAVVVTFNSTTTVAAATEPSQAHSLNLIEQIISLPDVRGRIDHFTADPKRKRLFVSAVGDNTVEVIDVFGGKQIQTLTGFEGPKTPIFISEFDKLFVISTTDAKVRIFDGGTYALRKTIDLPGDFEMIRYDPTSKQVFVGWGDPKGNGGIAVIDPATEDLLKQNYDTSGSPESFEVEAKGPHIFANVPDAGNVVVSIDRNTGETKKWPIKGGRKNVAMALDEADHRLFTVTRRPPVMGVFDTESGKEVAEMPVVGDSADVFFDKNRKRIYVIGGWGYISVIQQKDPDHYELLENVSTRPGARAGYFYAKRDLLYVGVQPRGGKPAEIWTFEPQD
jgi:DNA-binding beta-propeller fold protein YncE